MPSQSDFEQLIKFELLLLTLHELRSFSTNRS